MHAALAQLQEGLAVQGKRLRDRVGAIGRVDDVVDDFQTMRVGDRAAAPGAQVLALAVEDQHRGILALEYVNAVLRICRHPANQAERLSGGQFEEIADQLVGVFARADLCHCCLPPGKRVAAVTAAWPAIFRPCEARRNGIRSQPTWSAAKMPMRPSTASEHRNGVERRRKLG
jgi:hypothetical protein